MIVVNIASIQPSDRLNYITFIYVKMLKRYELIPNRNSKTVFENHFTFTEIFVW